MLRTTLATTALLATLPALAHDGHGLSGPHWHATDVVGLLLVAGVAVAAWFIGRGK